MNCQIKTRLSLIVVILFTLFSCQRSSMQPASGGNDSTGNTTPPKPSAFDPSRLVGWWGRYQGGALNMPANPGYFRLYFGADSFYLQDGGPGTWFTTHDTIHIDTIFSSQVRIKVSAPDTLLTLSYGTISQTYIRIDSPSIVSPPITTVAGGGKYSFTSSGEGGAATSAYLNQPIQVGIDAAGNLYIADRSFVVWKVPASTGILTRVAGIYAYQGYSGDGGPATKAQMNPPSGMAVDPAGNIYITDRDYNCIRKISVVDGNFYLIAGNPGKAAGFSGDGGPATAALLSGPTSIAVDGTGNIYFSDLGNKRVRKINASDGNISTMAGNVSIAALTSDAGGNLYMSDGLTTHEIPAGNGNIVEVPATGPGFGTQSGMAVDPFGNIYASEQFYPQILKLQASDQKPYLVAGIGWAGFDGDGRHATVYMINNPGGIVCDQAGNIYFADTGNGRVRKVTVR